MKSADLSCLASTANWRRFATALRFAERIPEVFRCRSLAEHWWKLTSGYVGLTSFALPAEVRLRDGVEYRLEEFGDLETLWEIYFHSTYRVQPTDRVIVDAGANVGFFSCYAASRLPEAAVFALEPIPASYDRLLEHVRRNGLTGRVQGFNVALGSSAGMVRMVCSGSPSQNFCVVQSEHAPPTASVQVEAVRLGEFLGRIPATEVDLLKMDIEGSEYDVLLSSTKADLARVRRMDLEYHKPPSVPGFSRERLVEHLAACGFRTIDHVGGGDYGKLYMDRASLPSPAHAAIEAEPAALVRREEGNCVRA
jgi:FkbM family methyltransferase